MPDAPRRLSLLTPSGRLTLGNLLGALRPMAAAPDDADCFYGISDLHALTTPRSPADLRTREMATLLLAAGLDRSTLFVQSRVPTHTQLGYLLECVATTGELGGMIQFKEKSRGAASVRTSLFTYPVLMAADILLYGALKAAVTDAVVAVLEPLQKRYADLAADPSHVDAVYRRGAERCREVTTPVLTAAQEAIGLGQASNV